MISILLLTALMGANAVPTPPIVTSCPNGFRYIHGETGNVMYDDRDIMMCEGNTSCIIINYTYKTTEALVNATLDIPCQSSKFVQNSLKLKNLYPDEAQPIDLNLKVCLDGDQCIDFTPQQSIDLYCNRGVVVKDTETGEILVEDVTETQCKEHHTGCFTMAQTFIQDGKSAIRITGDCLDEWRKFSFIWNKFYPYTNFNGGYCEEHNCIAFKVWHKDGFDTRTCYCTDVNKPPGTYDEPIMYSCTEDLCNM